jgi:hypothetical protein
LRKTWLRGATAAASGLLALVMLCINVGFEGAGSVPDIENCGFLAGSLTLLALLYPLAAGLVALRACGTLLRLAPAAFPFAPRLGGRIGALGSFLYLGPGLLAVATGPYGASLSPAAWLLVPVYVGLCAAAGRVGGVMAQSRAAALVLTAETN